MTRVCSVEGCSRKFLAKGLCRAHYDKVWRSENRERILIAARHQDSKRRQNPNRREYMKKYLKEYVKTERAIESRKEVLKRYNDRREKQLELACPPWADRNAIQQFIDNCPPGYAVDHIAALRNPRLSGLHVLYNLRYIPTQENLKKGNRIIPELICAEFYESQKKKTAA